MVKRPVLLVMVLASVSAWASEEAAQAPGTDLALASEEAAQAPGTDLALASEEPGQARGRDGKFFPLIKLVSFANDPCKGHNGDSGICYTGEQCAEHGGIASGHCAQGYGVCCVMSAGCGDHITVNGTVFTSSSSSFVAGGSCSVSIIPPPGTCQILLLFEAFNIIGPVNGDCGNDSFIITGANPGVMPPILCGYNTGQHMYLNVDLVSGPINLNFLLSSLPFNRHWKIRVIFVGNCDGCKAPSRCLQYFRHHSGKLSSFNYKPGGLSQMLNNLAYTICFAECPGYCDVALTVDLSLGNTIGPCGEDYLGIGFHQFCGDNTGIVIILNKTHPAHIGVFTDDANDFLDKGFSLNYMHLPC